MNDKPQGDEAPQPFPDPRPRPPKLPDPMPSPEEVRTWDPEHQDETIKKPVEP